MTVKTEAFNGVAGAAFDVPSMEISGGTGQYATTPTRDGSTSAIPPDDNQLGGAYISGGAATEKYAGSARFWLKAPGGASEGVIATFSTGFTEVGNALSASVANSGFGLIRLRVYGALVQTLSYVEGWYFIKGTHDITAGEIDISLTGPSGVLYAETLPAASPVAEATPLVSCATWRTGAGATMIALDELTLDDFIVPVPIVGRPQDSIRIFA